MQREPARLPEQRGMENVEKIVNQRAACSGLLSLAISGKSIGTITGAFLLVSIPPNGQRCSREGRGNKRSHRHVKRRPYERAWGLGSDPCCRDDHR